MTGTKQANDTFQQVSLEVAETYEACFVPTLFAGLATALVAAAGVAPGDRVLDVACGTGIVARIAAASVGATGTATGVDLNEAMLTVARRVGPGIAFEGGDAQSLPFADETFDVVLCQSGLMFMPDPGLALREMARVARPGGTAAFQVWSSADRQTGFRPLAEAVARHAGADAVELISTYWRLGDRAAFTALCAAAGLTVTGIRDLPVTVTAPSVDAYVTTEIESTPLIARIGGEVYRRIRQDARNGLAPFCDPSGALAMPLEAYLVTAARR